MHERERQCQQLTRDLNDGLMNIEDYTTAIEGITQQIKTGYLQASDSLQNPERAIQLRQQAGTVALNMQNATNTVIARVRNRYGGFNSLTAYRAAEKAQQQRQEGLKKRKGIINIQLSTVGIKQELQFQFADSQEYSTFYKKLAEEVNFLGNCSTRGTTYSLTINTNNFFCGNLITITLESSPESSIVIQAQHFGFIGFLYERLGLQNLGVTSHKNEWTNSAGKPRSASILTFSASLTNILRSGQPIKLPYQMFSQFDETEEVVAAAFRPPVPPLPRQNQLAITSNYTGLFPAAAHSKQKEEDPTEGFFVALSKKTSKTGHKRQPSADEQAKAKRPGSFNSTTF